MKGEDKFYGTGCSISIRRLLRRTLVRSVILLSQAFLCRTFPIINAESGVKLQVPDVLNHT